MQVCHSFVLTMGRFVTADELAQSYDLRFEAEMELVPLAHVIINGDWKVARMMEEKMLIRSQAVKMYRRLSELKESDDVLTAMQGFVGDEYLRLATSAIDRVSPEKAYAHVCSFTRKRRIEVLRWQVTQTTDEKLLKKLSSELYAELTIEGGRDYYTVDPEHPSPPMESLLCIGGVDCFPKKELSAIKAKAKNGKTHLGQIICAAAISKTGDCCGVSRKEGLPPHKVLFVDTEQSYASSDKLHRNILKMGGYEPDRKNELLTTINLRLTKKDKRLDQIRWMLIDHQYDLIMLDGIKDIAHDINDNKEADKILVDLLAMIQEHDVNMTVVLHENPGKEDDKMRGHLGTETLNKAFEVFAVAKDKDTGIFNVENSDRREKEVPTFAFHFVPNLDSDGEHLELCDPAQGQGQGQGQNGLTREEKQWKQFCKAFEKDDYNLSMTKEEIIKEHLRLKTLSESTTKNRIKQYIAEKRLIADGPTSEKGTRYGLATEEKLKLREAPIIGVNDPLFTGQDPQGQLPF